MKLLTRRMNMVIDIFVKMIIVTKTTYLNMRSIMNNYYKGIQFGICITLVMLTIIILVFKLLGGNVWLYF